MVFSNQDFVTVNDIKADVLVFLNDEEEKLFTPGFYTSQIQQALQELSFETFFLTRIKDFKFPTETLSIELPKGAFNLKNVYVFNGDECTVESSANVWIKRNYNTKGEGKGNISRSKEGGSRDTFIKQPSSVSTLYCSIQNGYVMFSSSCNSYDMVRLEYSGVQTNVGDVPIIPLQFREAVKLYVMEKCLAIMALRNSRTYRPIWTDIRNRLYNKFDGVWQEAIYRTKVMDTKEKEDLTEYLMRMNY